MATPAEVAGGSALGGAIGGAFGLALDWLFANGEATFNSGSDNTAAADEAVSNGDASAGNTNP